MEYSPQTRPAKRGWLLSVLLLGILATCLGIAWGLVQYRRAPIREGQKILHEIHQRGLSAFWDSETAVVEYRLIRRDDKIIGWQVQYRQPISQGGFRGEMKRWRPEMTVVAEWQLDASARRGQYTSNLENYVINGRYRIELSENRTTVHLEDTHLQIKQLVDKAFHPSKSRVPENYAPEGTLSLLKSEVARRKSKAQFKITYDSILPANGKPLFVNLLVEYQGRPESPSDGAVLNITTPQQGNLVRREVYDAGGNFLRAEYLAPDGKYTEEAVTLETLKTHFPDAMEKLQQRLEESLPEVPVTQT